MAPGGGGFNFGAAPAGGLGLGTAPGLGTTPGIPVNPANITIPNPGGTQTISISIPAIDTSRANNDAIRAPGERPQPSTGIVAIQSRRGSSRSSGKSTPYRYVPMYTPAMPRRLRSPRKPAPIEVKLPETPEMQRRQSSHWWTDKKKPSTGRNLRSRRNSNPNIAIQQFRARLQVEGLNDKRPELTKRGYSTLPSIAELARKSTYELKAVKNFQIIHEKHGRVTFQKPVDLRSASLDEIVHFDKGLFVLYPDGDVPPKGEGLNVEAQVQLDGCWPRKRTVTACDSFAKKLRKHCQRQGLTFEGYDAQTGRWRFEVGNFIR